MLFSVEKRQLINNPQPPKEKKLIYPFSHRHWPYPHPFPPPSCNTWRSLQLAQFQTDSISKSISIYTWQHNRLREHVHVITLVNYKSMEMTQISCYQLLFLLNYKITLEVAKLLAMPTFWKRKRKHLLIRIYAMK